MMNAAQFSGVGKQSDASTIVERLSQWALKRPHDIAAHYIADDGSRSTTTYLQLERRSLSVSRVLTANAEEKSRALILLPSGSNYLVAFFAVLYARMIAVPAYPLESKRAQHLDRLLAILSDASPCLLLTDNAGFDLLDDLRGGANPPPKVLNLDAIIDGYVNDEEFCPALPARDDIAFLQYTSGSTAAPKGVMVSHGNLVANEVAITRFLGTGGGDTLVSWLPLYHDMGLIGSMLQAIHAGIPLVLMSPRYFLERPVRWLEAMSEFRGTLSGGPDFAFRLCVERVKKNMLPELDLSHWRAAFCGSEPIRFDTLQQFSDHFDAAGFSSQAFMPCYGLAEATLYVSGESGGAGPVTLTVDTGALAGNRIVPAGQGTTLVGCGQRAATDQIVIVDDSGCALPDDLIGEICVAGPSIAQGYWKNPEATAATFVERNGQRLLRTGDLGFQRGDQLFVTGRIKDVIVIRGQNLYPQDIERIVEDEVELVRKSRVAAFALDIDGSEVIGIAAEVGRSVQKLVAPETIARTISECVADAFQEPAGLVLLLNPGALPKTSSGKLQRSACRKSWLAGDLDLFAAWQCGSLVLPIAETSGTIPGQVVPSLLAQEIACQWREILGVEPRPGDNFFSLGGNSIKAVQLAAALSTRLERTVELHTLFENPVFTDFVAAATSEGRQLKLIFPAGDSGALALQSYAQSRLWFFTQLEPDSNAYNVSATLRLRGRLQPSVLARALTTVVERHAPLRTTFDVRDDQPIQNIHAPSAIHVAEVDLRGEISATRSVRLKTLIADALRRPFDLRKDLPLRALLVACDDDDWTLVITSHHIAADGWSTQILLRELAHCYASYIRGESHTLAQLPIAYVDYASWQRQWLDAGEAARQLAFWRDQLGESHEPLELPTDRARPPVQSFRGAYCAVHIDASLAAALRDLARNRETTLFVVLLAAFDILLYRLSGCGDLRVGVPVANRQRPETAGLIGFFVNTLVIRTHIRGDEHFGAVLQRLRQTMFSAQAHQDLPFEKLVDELQPARSLSCNPLCQVKFNVGFTAPALPDFGGLVLDGFATELPGSRFDLALDLAEQADGALSGAFTYAADLFDAATIESWNAALLQLLQSLAAAPEQRVAEFALPSAAVLNADVQSFSFDDVVTLLAAQCEMDPAAVALRTGDRQWTRAELHAAADQVAQVLLHKGVVTETPVALCCERSAAWVIGLLGTLKAGCVCVPLDPAQPVEHLRGLLKDVGARHVLGAGNHSVAYALDVNAIDIDALPAISVPPVDCAIRIRPGQLAYIVHTSGSTGRPKAVAVTHGALANYVQGVLTRMSLPSATAMAMVSSVGADLGHTALFGALCGGHVLCLADADAAFDPDRFADFMREHAVAALKIVPSHLRGLLQAADPAAVLPSRLLVLGGEAIDHALLERVRELRPQCRIINHYGPTETTVGVLTQEMTLDEGAGAAPLGTPLANQSAMILDGDLNPVCSRVAGELFIGGAGVARGYLGQPGMTAERFVPNPWGHGDRLYRSGDKVRLCDDGAIEFLGRLDDQLKIRGFRVEPEEVAAGLRKVRGVLNAAVVVKADDARGAHLVGYCECERAEDEDPARIRTALRGILPEHLIPSFIVPLPKLPLTPNGKFDRQSLPAPSLAPADNTPLTELEQQLATIWCEVLKLEHVGASDNFFLLGGDSILSLQIVARARRGGLRLSPKQIFEGQTIRALAALLSCWEPVRDSLSSAPQRIDRQGPLSLSHAQGRLWFLWQLEPDNSVYNVTGSLRLCGALDHAALQDTFTALVARHEVLRTVFPLVDGTPVQVVTPAAPVSIPLQDLSAMPAELRARRSEEIIAQVAHTVFDLVQGPLLTVQLLKLADCEHLLLIAMHHIVSDGWSVNVFIDEFARLYAARVRNEAADLPALPIQYVDYASWQRRWLDSGEADRQLAYWRAQLHGAAPSALMTDRVRPAVQSYRGALHTFALGAELAGELRQFAARRRVTLSTVLLAGFAALLHRRGGAEDLRIGLPVANRRWVETEGLIGFFVNVLVIRADLGATPSFAELLDRLEKKTTDAQLHQDLPFEQLVEVLNPERSLAHHPLFQITYNHRRREFSSLQTIAGLDIDEPTAFSGVTQFDLTLNTEEIGGELRNSFTYSTDLFQSATIAHMAAQFVALLQAALAEPDRRIAELPLCAPQSELATAIPASAPRACLHHLFEQRAAERPAATALVWHGGAMTYAMLNAQANQLACKLRGAGVGREHLIGICAIRGPQQVIAQLAVLKAGAGYLPLDPLYPKERLALMLADAAPRVVLADADGLRQMDSGSFVETWDLQAATADLERFADTDLDIPVASADLAYCIYTSGSTAQPKGVLIPHAAAVNHMLWMQKALRINADDRIVQKTPFSFDASVWEFWVPLLTGGVCLLAPVEAHRDPALLWQFATANGATVLQVVPSLLRALLDDPGCADGLKSLRHLCCGGEILPAELVDALPANWHGEMWNLYGPTETTIDAAFWRCDRHGDSAWVPIGRAVDNLTLHVLDPALNPVPVGVLGEIYIGGIGLARGYLQRPVTTAERFVPDPFVAEPGARLYRSGDLGHRRDDGAIDCVGRADQQIKLRGHRIEPGEIEGLLRTADAVRDALVIAREDVPGDARLVAYVTVDSVRLKALPHSADSEALVGEWETVFDDAYALERGGPSFTGWNSSYTDAPIPVAEMQEWLDTTVARIARARPGRLLELGCGIGLLLQHLAPSCRDYCGTDLSAQALAELRAWLQRTHPALTHIRLEHREAADFTGIADRAFDAVVLNSVVQYFPDIDYLLRVLDGATRVLDEVGFVFVGDIRHLGLLAVFHTSVEWFKASPELTVAQLRHRIGQAVAQEKELVIEPGFFHAAASQLGFAGASVALKRSGFTNELSKYRYDVTLHKTNDAITVRPRPWCADLDSLAVLGAELEQRPQRLLVVDIPNRRLARDLEMCRLLADSEPRRCFAELDAELAAIPLSGEDPEQFWALADRYGYEAHISWTPAMPGHFDVEFTAPGAQPSVRVDARARADRSGYATDPLLRTLVTQWGPQLREWLQQHLPDYMVPSHVIVLDAMPLMPNGKIDRAALPVPDVALRQCDYAAPRTATELQLAQIWQDVLQLGRVGIHDNFFELGGHSLLATQVVSRLRDACGIALPLRSVFEHATLAALAEAIDTNRGEALDKDKLARLDLLLQEEGL